jgi:DNA-binding CsgD family transcriptional regulator/PAS domain-containing protein
VTLATPLNRLLATLYAAPTRPEMWNVFLKEFGTLSGVSKAALISHHFPENNHRMLAALGEEVKDRENVRLYEDFYFNFDEWTSRFTNRAVDGTVVQGEEIWPRSLLLKSTFYNEFLKKVDTCQMACVVATSAPGAFECLSIYRGPHEPDFENEQLAALQLIVPHLRTALYTRSKLLELQSRVSDMETALDSLNSAMVLIDGTGKVVFANRKARAILDRRDGLRFDRGRLANAISAGMGKTASSARAMLVSRTGKRPLQVAVGPIRPGKLAIPEKAVAIVFISDTEERRLARPEILRALFDLTPAETNLAAHLLDGKSLSEAADHNGVVRETVRSQLKSIFLKTGTRRQGELIAMLLGLPNSID